MLFPIWPVQTNFFLKIKYKKQNHSSLKLKLGKKRQHVYKKRKKLKYLGPLTSQSLPISQIQDSIEEKKNQ
jgi:hypothetical protein